MLLTLNLKLFAKALNVSSMAMMDAAGVCVKNSDLPSYAAIERASDRLYGRKDCALQKFYCQKVGPVLFKRRYRDLLSELDALAYKLTDEWMEACIVEAARIIVATH